MPLTEEEIIAKAEAADAQVTATKTKAGFGSYSDYKAAQYAVRDQFRKDLETLHFEDDQNDRYARLLPQIPEAKLALLWKLAWDHGHSAGFHEVAMYYGEFAELLKD